MGEALAREDRTRPVQALVFLGDNFYPDGVSRRTLKDRVRENLAGPYCHFVWLTAQGRRALRDHCDRDDAETHPIPLIAVLGNHDVHRKRSGELERTGIPRFIGNWVMAEGAHSYELGAGVSLVAYDSNLLEGGGPATALAQALRASAGPWRILAAHHPLADSGAGFHTDDAAPALAAIREVGKPVHLMLAGHQHSLQALRAPGAALHVISGGGGASVRDLSPAGANRLYAEASYGFARVDASADALEVTLFALAGPLDRTAEPRARFRIAPGGEVSALEVGGER